MQRRRFIRGLGTGSLAALGAGAVGVGHAKAKTEHKWRMVTTWPKNFPGLGTGAERLAELIETLSAGRIRVRVFGANELVPPFEVLDTVARGTAQIGHGAAYYWKGKSEAAQFFSAVPFGLTAQEMNGWLYHGGGLELWTELYDRFGLIPAPAGNTGVQMGGWFNKEIRSLEDLKGLKMRIPGLGGEVLQRAGGTPVNLPGNELFIALQNNTIDATEWVGPYNDLAFGLYKAAKYYYYPGWHEPGTTLEAIINKEAFAELSEDLQAIVLNACKVVNQDMLAEYTVRNPVALKTLLREHQVELRRFPDDVIERLRALSEEVVAEIGARDAFSQRVYASFREFFEQAREWGRIAELTYMQARDRA
ncbi:TRAP transporter substrate-binding protein [Thiococcus pfennigii]|uniref:TRAP transporter substrate-binding protein n=1 Tax=Thiococcus pfennigii TaxID=1057 RepID=UPI0019043B77|nr:TRAP transporter substrate-binding protein [Thiococcus pfennigii]MBK1732918.1 ABC transporter substrate-binding protein [Thiococcus pfennigii]